MDCQVHLPLTLQIPSLGSGLSQCFDVKKSWLVNHNSFKSSPTLRLEGPGGSAVIAAIALCHAPGKASAAVLTIPAFSVLVHLSAQLRDKVWVWLPHFVWDRAIKLQHLVWLRIFFFPFSYLSQMMRTWKRMTFSLVILMTPWNGKLDQVLNRIRESLHQEV